MAVAGPVTQPELSRTTAPIDSGSGTARARGDRMTDADRVTWIGIVWPDGITRYYDPGL